MNPARAPLPRVDAPELLQVRVAKRVSEGRIPFSALAASTLAGRPLVTPTTNGALVLHSDSPDFVIWSPDARHVHPLSLGRPTRAVDLDASGQRIAMAATGEIRLLDRSGATSGRVPLESHETEAFVRFDRSGTLWVLTHVEKRARLRAVGSSGALIDQLDLRDREDLNPAWWLEAAHPSRPLVVAGAGAGQDGAFFRLAELREGRIVAGEPRPGFCFGAWCPTGSRYGMISHHGATLAVCSLDGLAWRERDLDDAVTALDDSLTWQAWFIAEQKVILATNEGRLLAVDFDEPRTIELRLDGDERNWGWSWVYPLADKTLMAARGDDDTYGVWRLPL